MERIRDRERESKEKIRREFDNAEKRRMEEDLKSIKLKLKYMERREK